MLKDNGVICSLAFSHVFTSGQGDLKPCCRFNGSTWKQIEKTQVDAFRGQQWSQLREKMLQGEKIPGCIRCYQEEEGGKKSIRQIYNEHPDLGLHLVDPQKPKLIWLELPFSNRCNVACRMCDSRFSTRWHRDEKKLYGRVITHTPLYELDLESLEKIADDFVHFKITGGEPFFDRKHLPFLQMINRTKNGHNVFINYSTNVTIMPSPEVIEAWRKLRHIELAVSIDSIIPEEIHYTRYPSDGKKVLQVARSLFELAQNEENIHFIMRSTVHAYNIFSMPETLIWWSKLKEEFGFSPQRAKENPTHLTFPRFMSATSLSQQQKKRVSENFKNYKSKMSPRNYRYLEYLETYMYSKNSADDHAEFIDMTHKMDKIRDEDASKTFPHLHDLFES